MKKLIALLSILLIASLTLNGIQYFDRSTTDEELPLDDSQIEDSSVTDSDEDKEPETSLANAINLLPSPELAIGGYPFGADKYWVWTAEANDDGSYYSSSGVRQASWVVDLASGKATKLADRALGAGTTVPNVLWSDEYLEIIWKSGWETFWIEMTDYVDLDTGVLSYSLSNHTGQKLTIESGETTLEITYAPSSICDGATFENPSTTDMAEGLLINGKSYPFPSPMEVECRFNDMGGEKMIENFPYINLSETSGVIRFGLAKGAAEIPLSTLSVPVVDYR
ncbi:hypothetical protein IPG41_04600 [Candidatus Peregrinibacteria bacterium]|nr:MAG: hypothetical protein IPG41_04600 [Candidatus Peregrinibacteria bacterium]